MGQLLKPILQRPFQHLQSHWRPHQSHQLYQAAITRLAGTTALGIVPGMRLVMIGRRKTTSLTPLTVAAIRSPLSRVVNHMLRKNVSARDKYYGKFVQYTGIASNESIDVDKSFIARRLHNMQIAGFSYIPCF
jgi:hypothetical protein